MKNYLTIEGQIPEGYVVLCRSRGGDFSFLVRNLGLSVECPHCGATAHSAELAMEYYLSRPSKVLQPKTALRRAAGRREPAAAA